MKLKISKIVVFPTLYGILAGCVVAAVLAVILLHYTTEVSLLGSAIASLIVAGLAVTPAVRRAAWAYSNVRKYHNAEYFYDLGNGVDNKKALAYFEQRALKASNTWMKRYLWKDSLPVIPVFFFLQVARYGNWLGGLWVFIALALMALGVFVGTWTLLLAARKMCYDQFGNIKNV